MNLNELILKRKTEELNIVSELVTGFENLVAVQYTSPEWEELEFTDRTLSHLKFRQGTLQKSVYELQNLVAEQKNLV